MNVAGQDNDWIVSKSPICVFLVTEIITVLFLFSDATFVICLLLGSLNSCCNPWIYMLFSGSLMQQLFPCCRRHQHPRSRERVNSVIQVCTVSAHPETVDLCIP